jgi:lipopolysaccharide transport system ATP-binding protein
VSRERICEPAIRVCGLGKVYNLESRPLRAHEAIERTIRGMLRRPGPSENGLFWAVKDCSFTIHQGEVVALLGRNGAGKSVLLKMLSRIVKPTTGKAEMRGRLVSLLELGSGFHPEMTGRENVFLNGTVLGLRRSQIDARFDEIVEFSGIRKFLDMPVKSYSSGMSMRLAFSIAAHVDADVLLLDEVLAVGDVAFQEKCLAHINRVAARGVTILIVSHEVTTLAELCTRGFYLRAGRLLVDGSVEEAVRSYIDHV